MKFGKLTQVFSKFAWKKITSVEVNPTASNGHEFNSSPALREILGEKTRSCKAGTGIITRFLYFPAYDDTVIEAEACLSWYDSRAASEKRTEWRLYYTDNLVIGREGRAQVGDFLVFALDKDNDTATVLVAQAGSTSESQLRWLFGINEEADDKFVSATVSENQIVDLARSRILEAAGIILPAQDEDLLGKMLALFGSNFPTSAVFGAFVREQEPQIQAKDNADNAIIEWMEREEFSFRVLEKHIVEQRLKKDFMGVDDFVQYSLSVQNRRKSRAGLAFENHLAEIFKLNGLVFSRHVTVENKSKPDFLFPSKKHYMDNLFPVELLTLLGAKTTCKERWQQVLAESTRVTQKKLVTLEPAISTDQLIKMRNFNLQLVVPLRLQETYPQNERHHLWSMATFIESVQQKQIIAGISAPSA